MSTGTTPMRVQLRRVRGWRMPGNTVKVDRTTKWGNPFRIGSDIPMLPGRRVQDARHAFALYVGWAPLQVALVSAAREELQGKNLACWCTAEYDAPCHARVLLQIANGEPT